VKLFGRLKRALRRERPPMLPTRVYVRPSLPDGDMGVTIPSSDSTRYRILIWDQLDEDTACLFLVHEWAHAVRGTFCRNAHDARYWIEHGKCDAVYVRIVEEQAVRRKDRDEETWAGETDGYEDVDFGGA
jgi:hypothetical protein